jgi:hypothetical protein
MNDLLKRLAIIAAVVAFTSPLAACIDGVTDGIADIASAGTDSILEDVDAGLDNAEQASGNKVDSWVAGHVNDAHGCVDPQSWDANEEACM